MVQTFVMVAEGPTKIIKLRKHGQFPTKTSLFASNSGFVELHSNGKVNNDQHANILAQVEELARNCPIVTIEGSEPSYPRNLSRIHLPIGTTERGKVFTLREKQLITVRSAYAPQTPTNIDAYLVHQIPLNDIDDCIKTQGSWKTHYNILGRVESFQPGTQKDALGWCTITLLVSETKKIIVKLFNLSNLEKDCPLFQSGRYLLISDLVLVQDKRSGNLEYRSARNKVLSFEKTMAQAYFPQAATFPLDSTSIDIEGMITAARNTSIQECCEVAFAHPNTTIAKREYVHASYIEAKEVYLHEDSNGNRYFYFIATFSSNNSEPFEIPFTAPMLSKFFNIDVNIENEDILQEQTSNFLKALKENTCKLKLTITFLEDKELFSFKAKDLILIKHE